MITSFKIFEKNEILPEIGDWIALNPDRVKLHLRDLVMREPGKIIVKKPKGWKLGNTQQRGYHFTIQYSKGWKKSFVAGGDYAILKTWVLFWSKDKSEVQEFLDINKQTTKYNL